MSKKTVILVLVGFLLILLSNVVLGITDKIYPVRFVKSDFEEDDHVGKVLAYSIEEAIRNSSNMIISDENEVITKLVITFQSVPIKPVSATSSYATAFCIVWLIEPVYKGQKLLTVYFLDSTVGICSMNNVDFMVKMLMEKTNNLLQESKRAFEIN